MTVKKNIIEHFQIFRCFQSEISKTKYRLFIKNPILELWSVCYNVVENDVNNLYHIVRTIFNTPFLNIFIVLHEMHNLVGWNTHKSFHIFGTHESN